MLRDVMECSMLLLLTTAVVVQYVAFRRALFATCCYILQNFAQEIQ